MAQRRETILAYIAKRYGAARRPQIKDFAVDIGVSEGAVVKWIYKERTPPLKWILKIESLTNGQITVHDW